jgi:Transposase DDE domain group 1
MVKLPIEYSDKPVTPFGGMALMKRFIDQTGIREHLATLELPRGGSNRAYDPEHVVEGFWLGIWTGASRYIHCDWLRQDQTLAAIFGFESLPSQSTYSRFFGRFSQARNTVVFPPLQRWFFSQMSMGAVTVDLDSTVITREGSQEGSAKGYNPNRRGRNSHHPLIAFISQTRMVANAWLRPGNTAASSSCVEFMRETFEQALAGVKVGLVRADSGFCSEQILSALEERGLPYIIAAKAYANLKHQIYGMKDWVEVCPGIAVKEWLHQPADPKAKARRHIVVRKQISRRPQAGGRLLFEDLPDYRFSLYVTNLDLPLDQIWNIYNSRADCEPSAAR